MNKSDESNELSLKSPDYDERSSTQQEEEETSFDLMETTSFAPSRTTKNRSSTARVSVGGTADDQTENPEQPSDPPSKSQRDPIESTTTKAHHEKVDELTRSESLSKKKKKNLVRTVLMNRQDSVEKSTKSRNNSNSSDLEITSISSADLVLGEQRPVAQLTINSQDKNLTLIRFLFLTAALSIIILTATSLLFFSSVFITSFSSSFQRLYPSQNSISKVMNYIEFEFFNRTMQRRLV